MKKTICIGLILLFLFAFLTACTTPKAPDTKPQTTEKLSDSKGFFDSNKPESPSESPLESNNQTASSVSPEISNKENAKGAIAASYEKYTKMKANAYKRFEEKFQSNPELGLLALTFLSVATIDLELLPLTIIDTDEAGAAVALGILGKKNVKLGKEGNKNVLTYSDKEGKAFKFIAEYDVSADSIQTSVLDEAGNEIVFFEYVKSGTGYAFQYYEVAQKGNDLISGFFDDTNITSYSVQKADVKPESIFKNNAITEEFAKKGDTFIFIKDGKMLVHDKSGDKTY
jgi:hypothetical protein